MTAAEWRVHQQARVQAVMDVQACVWCHDTTQPKVLFDSPSEGRITICEDGDACIERYNSGD